MAQGASRSASGLLLHASTVSLDYRAVLIRGASGSGKSALALQLLALGAGLVADDRTCVHRREDELIASAPDSIRGKIEARGIGILSVSPAPPAPVCLIVDLDETESERLPPPRSETVLGLALPVLRNLPFAHFPSAILVYLQGNRVD